MTRTAWFDEVQKNISDLIKRSPAADVERNVKAVLGTAFTKLDLVTREEFDIQVELLARSRARLEVLEDQLRALEQRVQGLATPATGGSTTPAASTGPTTLPPSQG
jgi:BMFP domain-containing protein YqiC